MKQTTFLPVCVILLASVAQSYEIGNRLRGIANKLIAHKQQADTESAAAEECPYIDGACNRVIQSPVICGEMSCEYDRLCEAINSGFDRSDCEKVNIASRAEELPIP